MAKEVATFTETEQTIIEQMGYAHIPERHLIALFQRAQVMGLNPENTSQISLIERNSRDGKTYTLQVGIAGLRRAARRIVKADKGTYSESEWLYRGFDNEGNDTGWTDFWPSKYGLPEVAKVIVTRDGQEFPHSVTWAESVQTYGKSGDPTPMWASKPTFMLGKNAAAGAYRKAFPDELGDVYLDSERFDTDPDTVQATATRRDGGREAVRQALESKKRQAAEPGEVVEDYLSFTLEKIAEVEDSAELKDIVDGAKKNASAEQYQQVREAANNRYYELNEQEAED